MDWIKQIVCWFSLVAIYLAYHSMLIHTVIIKVV